MEKSYEKRVNLDLIQDKDSFINNNFQGALWGGLNIS